MTPELEETLLCNLFMEIFKHHMQNICPEDRVNFLNYYYTVYKLCITRSNTIFTIFSHVERSRKKNRTSMKIWKKNMR